MLSSPYAIVVDCSEPRLDYLNIFIYQQWFYTFFSPGFGLEPFIALYVYALFYVWTGFDTCTIATPLISSRSVSWYNLTKPSTPYRFPLLEHVVFLCVLIGQS